MSVLNALIVKFDVPLRMLYCGNAGRYDQKTPKIRYRPIGFQRLFQFEFCSENRARLMSKKAVVCGITGDYSSIVLLGAMIRTIIVLLAVLALRSMD